MVAWGSPEVAGFECKTDTAAHPSCTRFWNRSQPIQLTFSRQHCCKRGLLGQQFAAMMRCQVLPRCVRIIDGGGLDGLLAAASLCPAPSHACAPPCRPLEILLDVCSSQSCMGAYRSRSQEAV